MGRIHKFSPFSKILTPLNPPFLREGRGLLFFVIMILSFLQMFCPIKKAHADTISEIIEMQKSIKTMRSDFIQEKHSKLLDKPLITRGSFFFVPAEDKFVWDYSEGIRIISDGKRVMLLYKELKEADVVDVNSVPSLPGSFSIERLREKYHVDVLETGGSRYILRITPFIRSNVLQEIIITLDKKGIPLEVRMIERTSDSTVIKFTKRNINIKIPDETFSINVPDDVRVRNPIK